MKLIIELDGPILDTQPACWHAYQTAATELGWAKVDPSTFWRLVRTGASEGQILKGSKPRHWKRYAELFATAVDSDDAVARMRVQAHAVERLRQLRKRYPLVGVTVAANVPAREQLLNAAHLRDVMIAIEALPGAMGERAALLRKLVAGEGRPVVAAGTDALARAATEAGACCIGVGNGACTSKRLKQAGAVEVYADVADLADAVEERGLAGVGAPTGR
jgi:phosphoglycolate phosphatase-like HAD superfamily hydrolase